MGGWTVQIVSLKNGEEPRGYDVGNRVAIVFSAGMHLPYLTSEQAMLLSDSVGFRRLANLDVVDGKISVVPESVGSISISYSEDAIRLSGVEANQFAGDVADGARKLK